MTQVQTLTGSEEKVLWIREQTCAENTLSQSEEVERWSWVATLGLQKVQGRYFLLDV